MSLALAFLAGLVTSLSPCVLPMLPLVVVGALSQHRFGALALCGGLALAFSLLGVTASLATQAAGFGPGVIRIGSAVLLLLLGSALLIPQAQGWSSRLLGPLATRAGSMASGPGLRGNFLAGTLLGAVWSPCSGPTLGAAVGLAAQAGTVLRAFVVMLVFGVAASLPLLALAYGARTTFLRNRSRLMAVSTQTKPVFGLILVLVSALTLFGLDKRIEAAVVSRLPGSWIDLTTRF